MRLRRLGWRKLLKLFGVAPKRTDRPLIRIYVTAEKNRRSINVDKRQLMDGTGT